MGVTLGGKGRKGERVLPARGPDLPKTVLFCEGIWPLCKGACRGHSGKEHPFGMWKVRWEESSLLMS